MTEYRVDLPSDMCDELADSFYMGSIIEITNDEPIYFLTEAHVDRINGVKIEIFSNEHPPPHFRVKYQGSTANYRIADCTRINGSGQVLHYEKNIQHWWKKNRYANKQKLIDFWDSNRPSDCPVGKYRE